MRSALPFALCLALLGCHHDLQNEDAVRRGVMDYLSSVQGLNVASMDVSIASMVFRQNEVDATVIFRPKGGSAAGMQPMTIPYTLERKGDRWVVKPRASGNPHGGMGGASGNPHGAMVPPPGGAPTGTLPPGHPTVPPQSPQ